jgi:hypothetical protein
VALVVSVLPKRNTDSVYDDTAVVQFWQARDISQVYIAEKTSISVNDSPSRRILADDFAT